MVKYPQQPREAASVTIFILQMKTLRNKGELAYQGHCGNGRARLKPRLFVAPNSASQPPHIQPLTCMAL